jgi:transcriptional regulator NrdR family protein
MAREATTFWCDRCRDWTPCPWLDSTDVRYASPRIGKFLTGAGVQVFTRQRVCNDCNTDFFTVEMVEDRFDERVRALEAVRKAIRKVK